MVSFQNEGLYKCEIEYRGQKLRVEVKNLYYLENQFTKNFLELKEKQLMIYNLV